MKTWNTFKNCEEEYKIKITNYGKSETDKSKYRPNISRLNDVIGATNTNVNLDNYEFKDGKDNGHREYILRSLSADITEKQEYLKKLMDEGNIAKDYVSTELQKTLDEMREKQNVTELNNSVNTSTTTTNNAN